MSASEALPRMRTIVVGLGRIGFGYHCPEVVKHPQFELVGVVDPLAARGREATDKWQVPAFETLAQALVATNPRLVVIASPTQLHAEQTKLAFAHGAHVFCDKPVASSLDEFDDMIAAGQCAGKRFIAYQPCRYHPEVRALKALIAENLLGPVHLIRRNRSSYERRQDWQAFQKHGGGILNNHGSHCLDELQWITGGQSVRSVTCQTRRIATAGDAEDFVKALLTCEDGTLIDLEISQAAALTSTAWEIFGAYGSARWSATTQAWQLRYFNPREAAPLEAQTGLAASGRLYRAEELPWREADRPALASETFDYYDAVWKHLAHDDEAPVTVDETRQLLQLIERCHASAAHGTIT